MIWDFYIAFHDEAGQPYAAAYIYALFNKNELMSTERYASNSPGETSVTCFAQIGDITRKRGQLYSDSYLLGKAPEGRRTHVHTAPGRLQNRYAEQKHGHGQADRPRSSPHFQNQAVVMAHRASRRKKDTYHRYQRRKFLQRKNHERIQEFRRVGSHPHRNTLHGTCNPPLFRRTLRQFHATGQNSGKLRPARRRTGRAGYSFSESYFPSSGYDIDAPDAPGTALTPLKVVTYFYDDNEIIGRFAFDSGNLNDGGMEPPVDENGDKIDGPVYLTPGAQLTFTYKGFTLVAIKLSEWGDIGSGGTTDM